MKGLLKSALRALGYEIRRVDPPLSEFTRWLARSSEAGLHLEGLLNDAAPPPSTSRAADYQQSALPAALHMIVEGWRFIPHSYALVNQWQLLTLARRADIAVSVVDVPFYRPAWKVQDGLFEPEAEQTLRSIHVADCDAAADITLRMFFPFDFAPSRSRLTAVFGTLERQVIERGQLADFRAYDRAKRKPPPETVRAVTPSRWSAEGFYKAGFRPEQVLIVPHGVDTATFRPMPDLRHQVRSRLGLADDDFVFLSVGAMTSNKGVDLLLRAFSEVSRKFPHARLVLKGMDPLYNSMNFLAPSIVRIPSRDRRRVLQRLSYLGQSFSHAALAMLYQVADIYVSPYRAEGFNIPVLEAAACGVPVICTKGGATDDFVSDAFALRIESKKFLLPSEEQEMSQLEPDLEHLIALMDAVIQDASWRGAAAAAAPIHVDKHYTWDVVVDALVRGLRH